MKQVTARAIWVSTITENTVAGEATGKGADATGGFIRLEGVKYSHLAPLAGGDFIVGDDCILLLDSQNRASSILEIPTSVDESEFFEVTDIEVGDGMMVVGIEFKMTSLVYVNEPDSGGEQSCCRSPKARGRC